MPGERQLAFFPVQATEAWKILTSQSLPLDENKYKAIRECYREIYESFQPGTSTEPFLTQVSDLLKNGGLSIKPQSLSRLVKKARALGIDDFPDPRKRAVNPSNPKAGKLHTPASSLTMPRQEHNAFAEIYRDLQKSWRKSAKKGEGFFALAARHMKERGFDHDEKKLTRYAQYRRRIGDINFPRIRGSQDIERMQVVAVDRIQALGVMATGLMHEILQPLQVVQTNAEQLASEIEKGSVAHDKLAERLARIIRNAKTINTVVQHVRTIARAGDIQTEAVNLRSAIEDALTLFAKQLQSRGIDVDRAAVPDTLPRVQADPIALERVFINLFTNARDAIEERGRGTGAITLSAREDGNAIYCDVVDDGTGITEKILDRIFDPYFTTKEVDKGTGMGLTEVLNLMIQFGGNVTVTSVPDQGTKFCLEFQKYGHDN
jgi:signal transduction histidine kinase